MYTATNFGLINRTYDTDQQYDPKRRKTQWQRFQHKVFQYNRESGENVQYKVLFLGRHGEGYHNVAQRFYGTHDWDKLRETIGVHTCDRRSSKTYIHENYPGYTFEQGFTENDELWVPDLRESDSAQTKRSQELLDDIFSNDGSTFISFSSHGGEIGALLKAINHRPFGLVTGAVIPVLVKADVLNAKPPSTMIEGPLAPLYVR
ncbi:hypothetical protein FGG08_003527 [Glutinoglossum americanum]|uniref:Phosphoglycerate mutase n=1 Tax=Glutinoglossum americanum TaxID=1670608 RepID=A0A9P8L0J8_9PEZI|nr:hypothetical protein FGG08_003527 [Glutinoglossum americanum]